VVNKSPIPDDPEALLGPITWGAAQLGIAQGVLDAVADGLIDPAEAGEVVILVALWVDPAANDETAVKRANREAMRGAIADALRPPDADAARALAERREEAANVYYTGG
jgi:5,6,7,8-tetrahydromethanopterin hydro-lyase